MSRRTTVPATAKHARRPPEPEHKITLAARIYGALMFISGVVDVLGSLALVGVLAFAFTNDPSALTVGEQTTLAIILVGLSVLLLLVSAVAFIWLGLALLKSNRRRVALTARVLIWMTIAQVIVSIMLSGVDTSLYQNLVQLIILILLSVRIDPTLSDERAAQRKVEESEHAEAAARGLEGRDLTGKGFLDLNFFTLFWEFVVCCVLGLVLEVIWHATVVDPGVYQDRAGLLFGPFSPIYGFGAVLVTLALNRLYNKNLIVVFVVGAVVGGAFEVATALFMQFGFGTVAWDYSSFTILGAPDPIAALTGGRTSVMFVCMWGVLALVWVKAFLPLLLKLVNLIPWKLRYGVTAVCAALMLVNGVMTLQALDCWFERSSGVAPVTAAGQFYATHYDNAYMEHRFQSMTMMPKESARLAQGVTDGSTS